MLPFDGLGYTNKSLDKDWMDEFFELCKAQELITVTRFDNVLHPVESLTTTL